MGSQLIQNTVADVLDIARGRRPTGTLILGVSGAQGSGKSTLVQSIAKQDGRAAVLSLDDVYLSSASRREMAAQVHGLFATRGVPGTHDLGLMHRTLDALLEAGPDARTPLPRFDKLSDDPLPRDRWPVVEGRPDLILVDGWCLGARPQTPEELAAPINELERLEDKDGVWRTEANARLAADYLPLWDRFDAILALDAPGFGIVPQWRMQQEEGLLGRPLVEAEQARIVRFCAHFERITRSMLAGRRRADIVVTLDEARHPVAMHRPRA